MSWRLFGMHNQILEFLSYAQPIGIPTSTFRISGADTIKLAHSSDKQLQFMFYLSVTEANIYGCCLLHQCVSFTIKNVRFLCEEKHRSNKVQAKVLWKFRAM